MGSPSRNVQYHPPRLSEDRLNLPQPHSPSLPTHCSGKSGMRPCLDVDHFAESDNSRDAGSTRPAHAGMNPSGDLICYTGGVYDPAVTDARLAYHSAVHRAARAYFWALDREDALAAVVAHAHLVRAVQAAEASAG